jgi:hypothetical protein
MSDFLQRWWWVVIPAALVAGWWSGVIPLPL